MLNQLILNLHCPDYNGYDDKDKLMCGCDNYNGSENNDNDNNNDGYNVNIVLWLSIPNWYLNILTALPVCCAVV